MAEKGPEVKKAEAELDEWGAGLRSMDAGDRAREQDSFGDRAEARLEMLRAELERLAAKARKAGHGVEGKLKDLFSREERVRADIEEGRNVHPRRWDTLRTRIEADTRTLQREITEVEAQLGRGQGSGPQTHQRETPVGSTGHGTFRGIRTRRQREPRTHHVVPHEDGWAVMPERRSEPALTAPTKAEAIKEAIALSKDRQGHLVIHRADGTIEEHRTFRQR